MNASVLFYSYTVLAVAVFFWELRIDDETYREAVQYTTFHICADTSSLFTCIIKQSPADGAICIILGNQSLHEQR